MLVKDIQEGAKIACVVMTFVFQFLFLYEKHHARELTKQNDQLKRKAVDLVATPTHYEIVTHDPALGYWLTKLNNSSDVKLIIKEEGK